MDKTANHSAEKCFSDPGYSIKSACGCRLVFGSVPISDMGMLTHGFSKKAMMDIGIADRIGATFVIGEPADLDTLRQQELPVSERRQADYLSASNLGEHKLAMWLRTGERGRSSDVMARRIFGIPHNANVDHPLDPDDLRRCLQFLDAVDAHDKIGLMRDASPEWAALVDNWDEIVLSFQNELQGKSFPLTYHLMRGCLVQAEDCASDAFER